MSPEPRSDPPGDPPAQRFADLERLSAALAGVLAGRLRDALAARGAASLVVSGGKSPTRMFELLRAEELDWSRVRISLADERWVPPSDAQSNEHLVRNTLLRERAAAADFLGLKNGAPSPDLGAVSAWETFARVPRPLDAVVLGMGDDGHTASLFPHSPNLPGALDASAAAGCVGMWAPTEPHARLSLNLSALLDARHIYLLINGVSKWQVYARAAGDGPVEEMPIRAVLRQKRVPLEVMWAP